MKAFIAVSITITTLMANCTVDMKKQYSVESDSRAISKAALECIKNAGVSGGCVKKENNTYTLQDNTTCIFNNGNEAVGIALYPDRQNHPNDVTILIEENGLNKYPNGFKFVPLHKD